MKRNEPNDGMDGTSHVRLDAFNYAMIPVSLAVSCTPLVALLCPYSHHRQSNHYCNDLKNIIPLFILFLASDIVPRL
jgi:hypothetical protein